VALREALVMLDKEIPVSQSDRPEVSGLQHSLSSRERSMGT
jgi:hypothetical protein